ncbi:MAG: hypothetical protein R3B13_11700 [Polyangiaceae bacterium]
MLGSARLGSARLRSARLGSGAALSALLLLCLNTGCGAEDPPSTDSPPQAVTQEAFSNFGVERVIPLRMVMMANDCTNPQTEWTKCFWNPPTQTTCSSCTSGSNCGPDTADYDQMRASLEIANDAVRALGVQFYISRIEKYKMPHFWNISPSGEERRWDEVRDELRLVYPNLSLNEFQPSQEASEHKWMHAAAIRAGEPREIIMWLAECGGGGYDGARPWAGASSFNADRSVFWAPRVLAHEFGHLVGLEHTMYPASSNDPERQYDGVGTNDWEYWDLYYGAGSPNTYFGTRAAAQSYSGDKFVKHTWGIDGASQNCGFDVNCTLTCCIGGLYNSATGTCTSGQTQWLGTPGTAGLAFNFAGDNPSLGVYRRGANAMMYLNDPVGGWCQLSSFSESQAEQVKKIMRSDIRIDFPQFFAPYADGYTGKRNLLGDYRDRSGFDALDFDGDGKRDIAVWQPPGTDGAPTPGVGRFRVLTSSSGYTSLLERDFGRVGDIPVPGYYDNDNIVDFAVLRRGGLTTSNPFDTQFYWLWCWSSLSHDCVSWGWDAWGYQYDVPLPNVEFDGNTATREIAIYRPTTGYLYWKVRGSSTWGGVNVGFTSRISHLHGLYDSDNKTDVVVYDPGQAGSSPAPRFQMQLSTQGWATKHVRNFNTAVMANAIAASSAGSQAAAVRHGGIPLVAESNGRRVLRAWDAYTGTFYTMWDPLGMPTTISACQWGAPRDVPLAGPIDRKRTERRT